MIEYLVICLAALLASGLTLFSGFGLGTLLVPVFALFFPIEVAIALTAVVHFLNNLFKLTLLGRHASRSVVLKFGLPAFLTSFLGAWCLVQLADLAPLLQYSLFGKTFEITLVKVVVAVLLVFFVLLDFLPGLAKLSFDRKYLPLGGALSGFFGGLSGNQGALRSTFLIKAGLAKEVYIATGVVIACLVDISRIAVYTETFQKVQGQIDYLLLALATLSAFLGAFVGNRLLRKITIERLHLFVGTMLIIIALALGLGLI